MDVLTEAMPGFVIAYPGGPEVGKTTPVTYDPADPGQIMFGFDDRVLWVSRAGWHAGTEALHVEPCGRKRIYPVQLGDVHWTVIQSQVEDLPVLQLYVQTFHVVEFVVRTYCRVPRGWEADFAGLADDVEFDWWLRSLAGAA